MMKVHMRDTKVALLMYTLIVAELYCDDCRIELEAYRSFLPPPRTEMLILMQIRMVMMKMASKM